MKVSEFEKELQLLNKDLSIRVNVVNPRVLEMFPDINKIVTVTFRGIEVCTMPADEIFDEKNGSYGVDLRSDGHFVAHRTRPEVLQIVKDKLSLLETNKAEADAFFGRGEYSDVSLRSKSEPVTEIVDEVPIELKSVGGEAQLEAPKEQK